MNQPRRSTGRRTTIFASLLLPALFGLASCASPAPSSPSVPPPPAAAEPPAVTHESHAATPAEPAPNRKPEAAPVSSDRQSRADALLASMAHEERLRRDAAGAELAIARKLAGELKNEEALQHLDEALRDDPGNADAIALRKQILFLLGRRGAEIGIVAEQLSNEEKVKREQTVSDLNRMYSDGLQMMRDGNYDDAAQTFGRLLDLLKVLPPTDTATIRSEIETLRDRAKKQLQGDGGE